MLDNSKINHKNKIKYINIKDLNRNYYLISTFILVLYTSSSSVLASENTETYYERHKANPDFYINEIDAFFTSIVFDDADYVKKAINISGLSPNTRDKYGNTALIVAIREQKQKVIDLLLRNSTLDVNLANISGETALMMACYTNQISLVKLLAEEKHAQINKDGWSAIHYAAINGYYDIVAYLIAKGAEVDSLSPNETTPLMLAARNGHIKVVKLLLDNGAELVMTNQQNLSAIDFANNSNQLEIRDGLMSRWKKIYGENYKPIKSTH